MRRSSIVYCLCSIVLPGTFLYAQDSTQVRILDEVVISVSRVEEPLGQAPRSITVISREDFDNRAYNTVGDLLATQPGIFLVGANQTPGTNQSLFLRGANSNQVLVLVDGVRISDPSTPNNTIDLSELSLVNVERIEILQGAHSTQYGSAAIGGVINIITQSGSRKGFHGAASVTGGAFSNGSATFTEQLELSHATRGGFYLRTALLQQNTGGINATLDTTTSRLKAPDRDGFDKRDGVVHVGFIKNKWDLSASYKRTTQQADIDNGAFADDDNNHLDFSRNWWTYHGHYQVNTKLKISAVGSVSNLKRINENDSSLIESGVFDHNFFESKFRGRSNTHEVQGDYKLGKSRLLAAAGRTEEAMDFETFFFSSAFGGFESRVNFDSIKTSTNTFYALAQGTIALGLDGRLAATGGVRYNRHSRFGSFTTFQVNPSFSITREMLLYASYATGFNAPSLAQLFDPSQDFGTFTTRGNPNLKPEKSHSMEVGLKKQFSARSSLTAALFYTRTTDLIDYVFLWNGQAAIEELTFADYQGDTYLNVAAQKVRGIQVSGSTFFQHFTLSGNITWIKGTMEFDPGQANLAETGGHHVQFFNNGDFLSDPLKQSDLSRRPQVTASAAVNWQVRPALGLGLNYRLAGSRFDSVFNPSLGPFGALGSLDINSYHLMDFNLRWQLNGTISLIAFAENLLDTNYREINGFATRGRSGYLKMLIKW